MDRVPASEADGVGSIPAETKKSGQKAAFFIDSGQINYFLNERSKA